MRKKFYRSHDDKLQAGVCGGLAQYFGWDAATVRLVAVVLILVVGSGPIAYIVLWLFTPDSATGQTGIDSFSSATKK